ncbi:MAG: quinol monooxygenase YgiN [Rhodothermales bacterium]|jgi:quinol monooxygenase YgiN
MSVLVLLEAKAKRENVSELSGALAELFPVTRAYDGCIDITAYLNDDGQTFVFIENWKSKAQYEKYLAWRTETGVMAKLASLLEEPASIRYFDTVAA